MSFAVIQTGGKQYGVTEGDVVCIEKIEAVGAGDKIMFDQVLLTNDGKDIKIGMPFVEGASIEGEVVAVGKNKKIDVVRYKAKSRYFKRRGHRQPHLKVKIISI